MKKPNQIAIREAAKDAAQHLAAWNAVEAAAKKNLEAVEEEKTNGNFCEFRFDRHGVRGVVKAGNVVVSIEE